MGFTYTDTVHNRGAAREGEGEKVKERSERFTNITGGTTGFKYMAHPLHCSKFRKFRRRIKKADTF